MLTVWKLWMGRKLLCVKLKDNPMGYTSVAYPTDELRLPQWFKACHSMKKQWKKVCSTRKYKMYLEQWVGI